MEYDFEPPKYWTFSVTFQKIQNRGTTLHQTL